ncbi:amino acid permease [Philodulcilactobacillus myokoensis]|uniref:Amino acid permease n=1 Tax=Philodulcilactobacillus myokoensis TaxID=2929573 RepID=A0A9W6B0Q5_9LACO|nr:amino acid permease [Philodulcilactobacillus myokoensis]GLB46488.1 amino acid permease [Philodulcilactobacillus myokoensis]
MHNLLSRVLQKASLDDYISKDKKMERSLTSKDLILMGVGAVIGAGIFITPGEVAAQSAGPGIMISFLIATLVCSTSAMCYAEFSSALPIAGSAYSYGSIIYGELMGWILGWALILEYMLAVASVASGFSAYLQSFLSGFGLKIPTALSGYFDPAHGTYINIFSVLIVLLIAAILFIGAKSSTRINDIIVVIKLLIILLFLAVGFFYIKPANWSPFLPFGMKGVLHGASLVFFAYLGFDTVSSAAAEVKNPKKSMPVGIIGTLIICTILYILVSVVLTGMVSYKHLNVADPVSFALQVVGQGKLAGIISLGAMAGMFTMMMMMIYSISRLIYSIGRDGLLPKFLGKVNAKHRVPTNSIVIVTIIIAIMSGFVSLDKLISLVNIGTLIAFTFISLGIIPLRKRDDIKDQNGFKVPFYPYLPIISALLCLLLLSQISIDTWIFALIWYAFGLVIYFTYGVPHSHLN